MAASTKYNLHYCRDCEEDFLSRVRKKGEANRTAYCPLCGENIFVDRLRIIHAKPFLPKHKNYTAEEDAIILEGRKRGMTAQQIADQLDGRSKMSVYDRMHSLRAKGLITDNRRGFNLRIGS